MANVSMKVEGLDKLRRALRDLPLNVQKNVLAGAVAKGANVIRDDAQVRAPVLVEGTPYRKPGTLKRAIYAIVAKRSANDSAASAFVGVRKLTARVIGKFKERTGQSGAKNPEDAFYWRFLEFGTAKMRARPFIRPAFDTTKEAAVQAIAGELGKGIDAEAKKLGWRL